MDFSQTMRSVDLFNNDLYQFTCSYSYFIQNKHNQQATFQIFFRKYPFGGQYTIFAGLETVKNFIKNLRFTEQHEKYLRNIFPHIKSQYFDWIKQDFSQKVILRAMKEGQIVFANEPILTYTGPLGFVQLLETPCLNLIGFATLVATNASRMVKAVYPKKCLEFGTRRAQGPDGALSASQYAYLGGFTATSNVEAASKLGIKCIGTMSHAYVTSFNSLNDIEPFYLNGVNIKKRALELRECLNFKTHDGQLAAFLNFCQGFPNNFVALIDSYSTLDSGMLNAIVVGKTLIQAGIKNIGIRLDSGDLGELSKRCRKLWNIYIPEIRLNISASDDLYEERLIQLENQKSQIDVYAIGTNIATCKKQPALGLVCKLVELDGVPKMKLSSTQEKATYPCLKKIYRVITQSRSHFDLIALNQEEINSGDHIDIGTLKTQHLNTFKVSSVRLLNEVFQLNTTIPINQSRDYVEKSKSELPFEIFQLHGAHSYNVFMTKKYLQRFAQAFGVASMVSKSLTYNQTVNEIENPSSPSKIKVLA